LKRTVADLRAEAKQRLADWGEENIFRPLRELVDRAGLTDVKLEVHPFDFCGQGEPMSFRVVACTVTRQPELNWMDAEQLRQIGVKLEYRDGGAFHRGLEWHPIDGRITEHCSDFDFRVAIEQPQHGKYAEIIDAP